MGTELLVDGYEPSSLNEWPGKVTAIIFLAGCNFRCGFCHNKDLVLNSASLPQIPFSKVLTHLKSRKKWIDAVEITGGEPAIHKDKVIEILSALKREGFITKVDTNGSVPDFISELNTRKLVDYWSMDVKASFENYSDVVRAEVIVDNIRESIKLIMESGVDYEFRTTVIPTIHTSEEVASIGEQIKGAKRYFIQSFAPNNTLDVKFMNIEPFSEEELLKFEKIAQQYVEEVQIR